MDDRLVLKFAKASNIKDSVSPSAGHVKLMTWMWGTDFLNLSMPSNLMKTSKILQFLYSNP